MSTPSLSIPRRMITLVRRSIMAAKLGFAFYGTSRTRFPRCVNLLGGRRELSVPPDGGYLFDVINVWLDDEYGLHTNGFEPATVLDIGANVGIFSLWAAHIFP